MSTRAFSAAKAKDVPPCPSCGQNTEFVARSEQWAEDCCEVWVTCICGFDATVRNPGERVEDVWGSLDADTIAFAFQETWRNLIRATPAPETEASDA